MELETLVMDELNNMDLHGAKIMHLSCDDEVIQLHFEIGNVTIDCTTMSEAIFQINNLTHANQVYTADEATLNQCYDWVKYLCSILHPIVNKHREELAAIATLEAQKLTDNKEMPTDEMSQILKALQDAKLEIEQLKASQHTSGISTSDPQPEEPPSTKKKVLRIVGNLVFYLILITTVLGFAFFGLQEPDAPPREIANHSVMTVLSRSMEPTIPIRSLVVARRIDPNLLEVDDVITYLRPNNTTVTHRIIEVIENYQNTGDRGFRLIGDNNSTPDTDIVRAENVIGEIVFTNLFLGLTVFFIQQNIIFVIIFLVLGIALIYVIKKFLLKPVILTDEDVSSQVQMQGDHPDATYLQEEHEAERVKVKRRKIKKYIHIVGAIIILTLFGYSVYRVLSYRAMYLQVEAASADIRASYTQTLMDQDSDRIFLNVDWDGLLARNADVVAWVHMPGTVINYPILEGETNEEYLRTDIDRQHSVAGSIFLEENNEATFLDLHTIIYGHNMLNGSKFADIDAIAREQIAATDAPYIYLYLPDGTVKIYQVIGAHLTDIFSLIYHLPVEDLSVLYELIMEENLLDISFDQEGQPPVLTLSTCAEVGGSPLRSVVFGVLIEEMTVEIRN